MTKTIINLQEKKDSKGYVVFENSFCSYVVRSYDNKIIKIFFKPQAQELNVESYDIIIHDNGIEFK